MIGRLRRYWARETEYLKAASLLDAVYFVSCIGDRLWMFSIGFFISSAGGLAWVAAGQLLDSLIKVFALPIIGRFLDRTSRLLGMELILLANNVCIAASAAAFYLSLRGFFFVQTEYNMVLLVVALCFNALSRVASEAQKTAFMKDWIVVLVSNSNSGTLETHNSLANIIDQGAGFFAPLFCGEVIEYFGYANTCIIFVCYNILSWCLEATAVYQLYQSTPALHKRDNIQSAEEELPDMSSIALYFKQPCFRPAFALALLFMTVLGFDNIAIAYGTEQGMSPATLGFFRSAGAILGALGAATYRLLSAAGLNVVAIGLIGLLLQNALLNLSSFSVFLEGNPFDVVGYLSNITVSDWLSDSTNAVLEGHLKHPVALHSLSWVWENKPGLVFFFLGITGARFGLWIADPSIIQIMQQSISESERYRVNLVQSALQEGFSVLKDIMVIAFPLAVTFGGLIVMSCVFVFIGLLVYLSYFITEGFPCRRKYAPTATDDISPIELKVIEPGIHPELETLLASDSGAPLQTNRTDAL